MPLFAIWAVFVFLKYLSVFGNATNLGAALIILFTQHLEWLSVFLAGVGMALMLILNRKKIVRFTNRTQQGYVALIGALLALPFLVWPLAQLLQGNRLADVLPGVGSALISILLGIAALGLGLRICRLLIPHESPSLLQQTVVSTALGWGILMFASLTLGTARLYYPFMTYVVLATTLFAGWNDLRKLINACRLRLRVHLRSRERARGTIAIVFVVVVFMTLLSAGMFIHYPVGYDSQISYLTYPKEYAEMHRIVAFPYWVYWGFPQNAEMLFALGWLLGGFQVPIGIIYIFTLLTGGVILLLLQKRKLVTKTLTLLIFFTLPVVAFQNLSEHKAEMIFAFYVLLSYFFILRWNENKRRESLWFCAIFSGIAAGLKYFFFPWYAIPIVLVLLWHWWRGSRTFALLRPLLVWSVITMAIFSPWIIKNLVTSGNPLDPIQVPFLNIEKQTFLSELGPQGVNFVVTEMRNEAYLLWDDYENKDLLYFLRAPFSLTFAGNKKYVSDGLLVGPLLLIFLPLILFVAIKRKLKIPSGELWFATISLPLLTAGWIYLGHLVIWYALPIYALFAMLAAWVINESVGRRTRFAAIIVILAWTAIFIPGQYLRRFTYRPLYTVNAEERVTLREVSEWLNTNLSVQSKAWGLHEPRGFYIDRSFERYIPDNYHLAFDWILHERGAEGMVQFLRENRIEYILIRGTSEAPDTPNLIQYAEQANGSDRYAALIRTNQKALSEFRDAYLELVHINGPYSVYRLKP